MYSCIAITLIMLLAFPSLIFSWGVMYIIFVRYFDEPFPMNTERIDDLPAYSALFPDSQELLKKEDECE
uniref:Uncharacterized protein n=1 Tax=Caenorhabditis japonica TaxID=281687 RepID=A0A8R1DIX2_CAEJA